MARLAFCDYHNMIAILEKYEHNTNFHQIVDFVEASHLRYALTINPTVYVSYIRQFWSTARIETTNEGTKILATVDGQFSHQWKYLIHTIMQCLSPKSTGFNEFSSNIATALVCLATNRVYNFSKIIFDGMVRNVNNKVSKFLMYLRVNSPSFLGRTVPLFPCMLVTMGEGSGTLTEPHHTPSPEARRCRLICHSWKSRGLSNPSSSSVLPKLGCISGYNSGNGCSGNRQQDEMALKITAQDLEIATLKARIKNLEDRDGGDDDPSGEDATIKGRRLEIGEEVASVLSSGVQVSVPPAAKVATVSIPPAGETHPISVPTGSSVVPTASPIFTTATVATPYSRRKCKEKIVESETPKKKKLQEQMDVQIARHLEEEMERNAQRMNEQIARDAEIARIHAEEELQIMIDGLDRNNETIANYAKVLKYQIQQRKPLSKKQQKEFYMSVLRSHTGWKTRHFKGMTLEEIKEKFDPVWKKIEDFIPIGSKEEGERFKKKGLRLEQDSAKKVKTSEEVSKEDLKDMIQLVPVEEVYVEALQVKHLIFDWEIQTEGKRSYWKIIRLGGSTTSYQFFVDMLKHFDKEDLNQLWALVKETLNIRKATSDKEKELWVELKRLYEPDVEDQLWTQTQALMHDPVEWRLYDSCGVHYVLSRDQEIFMLVEKEYPLRKGLAIAMIINKLQVENYS
nr:hypothetical protein [Tanacetum cinerariifolium]